MHDVWSDLRSAWRRAVMAWPISAVVVVTMALAIGASTAIFSVAHAVLLRPLPFRDPGTLVAAAKVLRDQPKEASFLEYRHWRDRSALFEDLAAATWAADTPSSDV